MEIQNPQEDQPSRDSSITLEDHNGQFPSLTRSELYTAHQRQREAYGSMTAEPFLMIPLDFPSTYPVDDPSVAGEPPGANVASPSLSVLSLERYLAEEQRHERFSLGVPALGSNKATVKKYLPEIIHNFDGNDASQAGATRGTTTEGDEGGSRRSTTSSISRSSPGSSELIETQHSNDALRNPSNMMPHLAGLGETDSARFKAEQASADSESHHDGPNLAEGLETGQILMRHRARGRERHGSWRVGTRARVRRNIRRRRRQDELPKDEAT